MKIGLEERIFIFERSLDLIATYSAHLNQPSGLWIKRMHKKYLGRIIKATDRYEFYITMRKVLAELRNGHSWFSDRKISEKFGGRFEFEAFFEPKGKRWIVKSSSSDKIGKGDVISSVNGIPTEKFYLQNKGVICESGEIASRNSLFYGTTVFPEKSAIELNHSKKIILRKIKLQKRDENPSCKKISKITGYIKIPNFYDGKNEKKAINFINKLKGCKTLIIDIRGNGGGMAPWRLISKLAKNRWRRGIYFERVVLGPLKAQYATEDHFKNYEKINGMYYKRSSGEVNKPIKGAYQGEVILLVDEKTASAAEEFAISVRNAKSGYILGATTKGSSGDRYAHDFGDGISIAIGIILVKTAEGKQFEGIGIRPDMSIALGPENIRHTKDIVLETAIKISEGYRK